VHDWLAPLLLFAAAVTLTPGPNVVLVTASAVNFGFRRTIPQILGITLGFGSMIVAAGSGLAGVVHAEPRLHAVLKYAGAAYLVFLAWRIARADAGSAAAARARPIGFVEAMMFTWMNPKAWVSALGALAAYTMLGGDVVREVAIIAVVLAAFCLLSAVLWAACGAAIGRFLVGRRARTVFNCSMASLLLLSLAAVLL
jgi:threonine/homoserine/homoserine lactone efflux protein